MARPSSYTEELADKVCARLADGESLRSVCRDEAMPDRETVRRWLLADEGFAAKYAYAREEQAEFHHEEMDDIERGLMSGEIPPQVGNVILTNKRWRMEKLKPRVYGARQVLAGDPDAPLHAIPDEQIDRRLAELMAKGQG